MIDRRKKVLLLIPNLTFGGAQRVFHDHSLLLSQHYEVIECVFNLETSQAFPSGNQVLSLDVKAGTNFLDKFLQRITRLRQIKKQYNVDICISHHEGADLVNILSRGDEKIVTWIHGRKRFDQYILAFWGSLLFARVSQWYWVGIVCSTPIVSTDCPTGPREMLTGDLVEQQSEYPYFAKFGVLIHFDKDPRDSYWTTAVNKLLEGHKLTEYNRDQSRKRVLFSQRKIFPIAFLIWSIQFLDYFQFFLIWLIRLFFIRQA
jgi:hypothetical protein